MVRNIPHVIKADPGKALGTVAFEGNHMSHNNRRVGSKSRKN